MLKTTNMGRMFDQSTSLVDRLTAASSMMEDDMKAGRYGGMTEEGNVHLNAINLMLNELLKKAKEDAALIARMKKEHTDNVGFINAICRRNKASLYS